MSILIVIPAHMGSRRLPGKPLLRNKGKSLLHYVWENAKDVANAEVIVTSDSVEIKNECSCIGANFIETTANCQNGTQRAAQVCSKIASTHDVVINLQVDEPEITPKQIEKLAKRIRNDLPCIHTLHAYTRKRSITTSKNAVKIWLDGKNCVWFSRTPMLSERAIHIGIYAYSNLILSEVGSLEPTQESIRNALEQVTWLSNGYDIKTNSIGDVPISINTQDDWEEFCEKHH